MRRRRRTGAGAIVRELRAQGDRIVGATHEATAEQNASRGAMAETMLRSGAGFLRAALDEATPRTVVLDPPVANDTRTPGPTTPPSGPANDDEPPPGSDPRR